MPISKASLAPLMRERYKTYALSVISSRALPDVRDGLKPVQRRILYAMHHDLNLSSSARFRKSAAITGLCMAQYHPHGDCLRASTLVYMADGTTQTIENLFKAGQDQWVWAYNENLKNLTPAKAYAFRVGQVTDTIYRVTLSNGGVMEMTGNHPVLTAEGSWVSAEKLSVGSYLYAGRVSFNNPKRKPRPYYSSPYSEGSFLQYKAGDLVAGHVKGHGDCKLQPFITQIEVVRLESPEPMYDFTVSEHQNMMIVCGDSPDGGDLPLVCVHNSSIYEAMVRLAQPFNTAVPLVDGHGNFGSLDGDGAASARYTEARLTLAALDLLEDLTPLTVPHRSNFDHTKLEPTVLPAKLPYLLLNGVQGIAVGLATNIPSHNQRETLEALKELLTKDKIETWPLPDFPTGGSILESAEDLAKLVQEGRGSFKIRGTYIKEGRDFILTSLPPQVAPSKVTEQLNKALLDGTLPGSHLRDVRDESGEAVRLVCTLSSQITDEIFLAFLCKHTSYEQSFSLNYTALFPEGDKMVPRQEGVEKILRTFLTFQDEIQVAKAQEILNKLLERKTYLEALLALSLVKAEFMQHRFDSKAEVTTWLKEHLAIAEDLANRIAQMALHQVATLKTPVLESDIAEVDAQIAIQEAFLENPKIRHQEILTYLKAKLKQCPERKTRVGEALDVSFDEQDLLVEESLFVVCSQQGWIKTQKTDPGTSPQLRDGDSVFYQGALKNTDLLMILTSKGRLYTLKVNDLPSGRGYGQPLQSMIRWSEGEELVSVSPLIKQWHLWCSSGYILSLDAEEGFFTASQVTGRPAIRLKDGETLKIAIPNPAKDASYLVISEQGQALHLNNLEEQVPAVTKAGRGVVGIKLADTDKILVVTDQEDVTVYTNRGTPHVLKKAHLRPLKRGGKGKTLFQRVTLTLEEPKA